MVNINHISSISELKAIRDVAQEINAQYRKYIQIVEAITKILNKTNEQIKCFNNIDIAEIENTPLTVFEYKYDINAKDSIDVITHKITNKEDLKVLYNKIFDSLKYYYELHDDFMKGDFIGNPEYNVPPLTKFVEITEEADKLIGSINNRMCKIIFGVEKYPMIYIM